MELKALFLFLGYWVGIVNLLSGLGLLFIWQHRRSDNADKNDLGLLFLAFSVFIWAIQGAVLLHRYYLPHFFHDETLQEIFSVLSIVNGACILLALPYFQHKHPLLADMLSNRKFFNYFVVSLAFISIVGTFFIDYDPSDIAGIKISWIPLLDFIIGLFTSFFLILMLKETFSRRGINKLGDLSVFVLILTMLAQFLKLIAPVKGTLDLSQINDSLYITRNIGGPIFMALLIMIFYALAYSSVFTVEKNALTKQVNDLSKDLSEQQVENEEIVAGLKSELVNLKKGRQLLVLLPATPLTKRSTDKSLNIFLSIPSFQGMFSLSKTQFVKMVRLVHGAVNEVDSGLVAITNLEIQRLSKDIARFIHPEEERPNKRDEVDEKKWKPIMKELFRSAGSSNEKGEKYALSIDKKNIYSLIDLDLSKTKIKNIISLINNVGKGPGDADVN